MLINYFKSAFRNVLKSKFFSVINILGLSLGMAGLLLIFQFVRFELSYDTYHSKANRIYRITYSKEKEGEEVFNTVLVYAGVGALMKQAFPEVEDFTRLRSFVIGGDSRAPVRYRDVIFEEQRVFFADENFFKVFSFPIVKGDRDNILKDQFTVAISESTSKKYFGEEDPIGKSLRIGQKFDFTISGVFADVRENSHAKFDFLISHSTLKAAMPSWWNDDNLQLFHGHLYLLLKPGADPEALASKFPKFVDDFINGEQLRKTGVELKYAIMPLTDIHLKSHIQHEAEVNGDFQVVKYLSIIGMMILLIAWINYINLSTSKSLERAREVGVRKVVGAYRIHLILQFFLEAVILNFISIVVALFLVAFGQNLFEFVGAGKLNSYPIWSDSFFWIVVLAVFILGVLLSGFYPAFVLSSFKPAQILKGKFMTSTEGAILRKVLVVFQFVASISLIICTITVYRQISYMKNRNLGMDIKRTLAVKAPIVVDSLFSSRSLSFKRSLLQLASVEGVSISNNVPGDDPGGATWYSKVGGSEDDVQFCYQAWVDEDYLRDYKIEIIAGRNFEPDNKADSVSVIINKACLRLFDFDSPEDALSARLSMGGGEFVIVGVVDNFHQQSSKIEYTPMVFNYYPQIRGYYSIKFKSKEVSDQVRVIQSVWKTVFPDNPFIYFFLDEEFDKQYSEDNQFARLLAFFSGLAIIIGCLGLFGLSSFMMVKRTKEIGIRKILGSSMNRILILLSREFILLVALSNLFAWPLSAYVMNKWLEGFAYHIDLSIYIFLIAGFATLCIAFSTIVFQVLKAARTSPVKSLRSE